MTTLLDPSAVLAQQHIDELLRDAARERLVRSARRPRRGHQTRVSTTGGALRPAATR
jgi:hypothetical protein